VREVNHRAPTLRAPWATAIARFGKDIENRSWRPPDTIIGQRIAIHEGSGLDRDGLIWLEGEHGEVDYEPGVVTCTAVVRGWVDDDGDCSESLSTRDATSARKSEWYGGPVGWVLSRVQRPRGRVKVKGMLGLWSLPIRAAKQLGG
jgi:hypothetical protein